MAQITVVYNSFEEMKEMAVQILDLGRKQSAEKISAPATALLVDAAPAAASIAPVAPLTAPVAPAAAPVTQPTAPATVPTSTHEYTLDDLARAGMTLMDSGRQADVQGLLAKFGVTVLPALPKERYGAFATALREMGAQI